MLKWYIGSRQFRRFISSKIDNYLIDSLEEFMID